MSIRECPTCHGEGTIPDEKCDSCHGSGYEEKTEKISVDIPAGVDDGQVLTVRGKGNAGINGGPPGDVLIYLMVKPHKLFQREGYDLYVDLSINMVQATLGDEVEVPTLEKPVRYKIPEGTQPGTIFRLKGKGIQHLHSIRTGDLFVQVNVTIPKRLPERQKKVLRDFASKAKLGKNEFKKPGKAF